MVLRGLIGIVLGLGGGNVGGLDAAEPGAGPPAAPAYLLVQGEVTDREKFARYTAALPPLYQKFGGRYLAIQRGPLIVEGDWAPKSVVVSQWPSRAAAEAFWTSPDYAAVRALREGAGTFSVMIIEGLPAAPQ